MLNTNSKTALKLGAAALAMFGFGYALVPLYDVFCEITGLNGKTGRVSVSRAEDTTVDMDRLVTVEFDTNINSRLEWEFKPGTRRMEVNPGKVYEAVFYVRNLTAEDSVGRAVPSVAPSKASLYFNKTECFCFSLQELKAGESKPMPVKFIIDPAMPESVDMLTLSYTFFPAPEKAGLQTRAEEPGPVPRS